MQHNGNNSDNNNRSWKSAKACTAYEMAKSKSQREEQRGKGKQGNEQLYMQHNGQDIIKPRFVERVWQCVGGVSKFLIVDAFAAGRTKIYEVRV